MKPGTSLSNTVPTNYRELEAFVIYILHWQLQPALQCTVANSICEVSHRSLFFSTQN